MKLLTLALILIAGTAYAETGHIECNVVSVVTVDQVNSGQSASCVSNGEMMVCIGVAY